VPTGWCWSHDRENEKQRKTWLQPLVLRHPRAHSQSPRAARDAAAGASSKTSKKKTDQGTYPHQIDSQTPHFASNPQCTVVKERRPTHRWRGRRSSSRQPCTSQWRPLPRVKKTSGAPAWRGRPMSAAMSARWSARHPWRSWAWPHYPYPAPLEPPPASPACPTSTGCPSWGGPGWPRRQWIRPSREATWWGGVQKRREGCRWVAGGNVGDTGGWECTTDRGKRLEERTSQIWGGEQYCWSPNFVLVDRDWLADRLSPPIRCAPGTDLVLLIAYMCPYSLESNINSSFLLHFWQGDSRKSQISRGQLAPCQENRIKRQRTVSSAGCKVLAPNAGFLLALMPSCCRFGPIEYFCLQCVSVSVITAESIAVLCSQPWGTVKWSTFLKLVDLWAREATWSRLPDTLHGRRRRRRRSPCRRRRPVAAQRTSGSWSREPCYPLEHLHQWSQPSNPMATRAQRVTLSLTLQRQTQN